MGWLFFPVPLLATKGLSNLHSSSFEHWTSFVKMELRRVLFFPLRSLVPVVSGVLRKDDPRDLFSLLYSYRFDDGPREWSR